MTEAASTQSPAKPAATAAQRRFRTLVWGAIPLVVLGGLISVDKIPGTDITLAVPFAAEGPGPTVDTLSAVDGTDVVAVTGPNVEKPSGELRMTTVSVRTNMTLSQVLGRWLTTDDTIVPLSTVMPKGHSPEQVEEANRMAFTQSESAATVTAMEYLKIPVKIVVAEVLSDAPANGILLKDDVITAVDGTEVSEPGQVQQLIRAKKPGDEIEVTVRRGGQASTDGAGADGSAEEVTEKVTLGEHPQDKSVAFLGVSMLSEPKENIDVKYNLQDVGGPSAGMMFSLAVIDKLSPGDLTHGKKVAGTGTIGEDGKVGPIGGIVHKVAASEQAGMELFLAPAANCEEATSRDHGDMVIASVDTIQDAIKAMDDYAAGRDVKTCAAQ